MPTIMIVDDTAAFRAPTAAALHRQGFDTIWAGTGREALKLVKQKLPDLILLDVAMPGMDGITCLKHLRSDIRTQNIPVVMLTAMAEAEIVVEAGRLNVDGYLLKSNFSIGELMSAVSGALNRHRNNSCAGDALECGNGKTSKN